MPYELAYHELVVREDIPALPKTMHERIRRAIESRLSTEPNLYGKPLRRTLVGYRTLRVGDYRVIFRIERMVVQIFLIAHRSVVYVDAKKRLAP